MMAFDDHTRHIELMFSFWNCQQIDGNRPENQNPKQHLDTTEFIEIVLLPLQNLFSHIVSKLCSTHISHFSHLSSLSNSHTDSRIAFVQLCFCLQLPICSFQTYRNNVTFMSIPNSTLFRMRWHWHKTTHNIRNVEFINLIVDTHPKRRILISQQLRFVFWYTPHTPTPTLPHFHTLSISLSTQSDPNDIYISLSHLNRFFVSWKHWFPNSNAPTIPAFSLNREGTM